MLKHHTTIVLVALLLSCGLALCATPGLALPQSSAKTNIESAQKDLQSKGYYHGQVDGLMGPATQTAIRQFQKTQNIPVTGRLDAETASKLGVQPVEQSAAHAARHASSNKPVEESNLKAAGRSTKKGATQFGHAIKHGTPLVAGKDFGKAIGHAGKEVGMASKKAVSTHGSGTSSNPEVESAQKSLQTQGYYHGQVDGVMGSQTRSAIRQFQKAENIPVTGRLDSETAAKLGVQAGSK